LGKRPFGRLCNFSQHIGIRVDTRAACLTAGQLSGFRFIGKTCLANSPATAGIAFHIAIAVSMGLISFSVAMIAALILYLRRFDEEFAFSFARNFFWKCMEQKRQRPKEKHYP
jgi:hypothetical protein